MAAFRRQRLEAELLGELLGPLAVLAQHGRGLLVDADRPYPGLGPRRLHGSWRRSVPIAAEACDGELDPEPG